MLAGKAIGLGGCLTVTRDQAQVDVQQQHHALKKNSYWDSICELIDMVIELGVVDYEENNNFRVHTTTKCMGLYTLIANMQQPQIDTDDLQQFMLK